MDTWTYMTEMHLPVAPGSYRFRNGFASKQKRKNQATFNLSCISSGVKAPLLSDLSHRAKIRYGLDVVMQKAPSPPEYIHHEDYVPPPTAEPQSRNKGSSFRKYKFAGGTVRESLDFKKLQPYAWVNIKDQDKGVPRAPDLLYRNTFGENSQEGSNLLSPRPQVRGFDDPNSSRSPSPRIAVSQPPSARARSPPKTPKSPSRPASEGSSRPVSRQPRQLSGRRLLKSLNDSKDIKLNVKPLSANSERDQREALNGSTGCLFSQVQDSIKYVKTVERGEPVEVPRLVRPLHTERGRYRPHSTVKITTPPRVQSPVTKDFRNHKSAEAYIRILANANRPTPSSDLKQSHNYIVSPSMSDIINQYMTPHERYNTPSSALHRIPDVNRPASRGSTRQSVRFEKIPDWARAETEQDREYESEMEAVSRAESTMGRVTEIPEVHIKYSDKVAPLSIETPKTIQDTERTNNNDP